MNPLTHILAPEKLLAKLDVTVFRSAELKKVAKFWGVLNANQLTVSQIQPALAHLWSSETVGRTVAASLNGDALDVLTVFRRHGGAVNGEVLRLDLLARKVLKIKETSHGYGRPWRQWVSNPVHTLAERAVLLPPRAHREYGFHYGAEADQPFNNYQIHPALMKWIRPAGPPPWTIDPAGGPIEPLPAAPAAQFALYLRRLAIHLGTTAKVKTTQEGVIAKPSLKSLAKAVPFPPDSDFPLADPQGLGVDLLRGAGVVRPDTQGLLVVDQAGATRLFEQSTVEQVHTWVRGWLHSRGWLDGPGVTSVQDDYARKPLLERQVLAWYLTALAGRNDTPWIGLEPFLSVVHEVHGADQSGYGWYGQGWDPKLPGAHNKEKKDGAERQSAYWLDGVGRWYANALMTTLPWLGVVERGRETSGNGAPWCFRLTPLGRAVFAAPDDLPIPPEPVEPFLVVQPNFDVVAYLDHAGVSQAATLGAVTESDQRNAPPPGPIQTTRLTPASVYLALENGFDEQQILSFLERYSRNELSANLRQSLLEWSAKRESIAVSTGSFLAFPSPEQAARYVAEHPGTLLGDRIVQLSRRSVSNSTAGVIDHARSSRRTLTVDESGLISSSGPFDIIQNARLWRIAEHTPEGWRITRRSITEAKEAGLKFGVIDSWLDDHLAQPCPPILEQAIAAWAGKVMSADLIDALVLHLPVPEQYQAVLASARFRPYLIQGLGPGWLLVRSGKRREVSRLLEELGFAVQGELPGG